jgi:cytidine deaminase
MNKALNEMFILAKNVRENAYAPYSKFKVGCCIRTKNNRLFPGANVEVLGRPSSCAEGVAVGNMVILGERDICEILIIGNGELFCAPCGNCRQIIAEFGSKDTLVHVCNLDGLEKTIKLSELLPYAFGKDF